MAVALKVSLTGSETLARVIRRMKAPEVFRTIQRSLLLMAFRVQELATTRYILPGGGTEAPSDPQRLRSRTGTLRRSISVDRSDLPFAIEIGSNLIYAPVHEFGATITARSAPFLVFKIPGVGFRTATSVTIPPRPFVAPALRDASLDFKKILFDQWQRDIG